MELVKASREKGRIWNKVSQPGRYLGRFMTLRWRLTLLNAALLTVLGLGLGAFIYFRLGNFLDDSLRSRMQDYAVTQTFLPTGGKSGGDNRGGRDNQGGRDN